MEIVKNNKSESTKARSFLKTTEVPKNQDATINLNENEKKNESKNLSVSSYSGVAKNINEANDKNLIVDLLNNNLIQGFIMSEILGSPKAKKGRGTIWNSRF